jgi:hypothetical protein
MIRQVLLVVAVVLFFLAGAGASSFSVGTVTLTLVPFGLACLGLSFLVR